MALVWGLTGATTLVQDSLALFEVAVRSFVIFRFLLFRVTRTKPQILNRLIRHTTMEVPLADLLVANYAIFWLDKVLALLLQTSRICFNATKVAAVLFASQIHPWAFTKVQFVAI